MKFAGICSVLSLLLLPAVSWADTPAVTDAAPSMPGPTPAVADSPYASIIARNIFGLVPLPPPDTNADKGPIDPPPKITPTGIMTIFGRDQALFRTAGKTKPGQPAKEDSYVLAEGERQDDIEVVKINHVDGIVTFNNHGTVQELPLLAAAASTGASPAGPAGGNAAAGMRGNAMSPGAMRNASFTPSGGFSQSRPATMGGNNNMSSMGAGAGGPSVPSYGNQQPQPNIEDQVMSAAQQMAQIEQNRIATQDLVDKGLMPPLPPTMMTPPDAHVGPNPLIAPPPGPGVPSSGR